MMNKLGTLLCGMAIDVAELAFYLLLWPLICCTTVWMLLPLSTVTSGLLPRSTTTSTTKELTARLKKVVARMPSTTPSSYTPMSRETTAIDPENHVRQHRLREVVQGGQQGCNRQTREERDAMYEFMSRQVTMELKLRKRVSFD